MGNTTVSSMISKLKDETMRLESASKNIADLSEKIYQVTAELDKNGVYDMGNNDILKCQIVKNMAHMTTGTSHTGMSHTGTSHTGILNVSDPRCGPGYGKCGPGRCCSVYGWCGNPGETACALSKRSDTMYDGNKLEVTDPRCGPGYGKCGAGRCCSVAGWCGSAGEAACTEDKRKDTIYDGDRNSTTANTSNMGFKEYFGNIGYYFPRHVWIVILIIIVVLLITYYSKHQ